MKGHFVFVSKRYNRILLMFIGLLVYTMALGILHNRYWDEIVTCICVDFIFGSLFFYLLEHKRESGKIFGNRQTSYKRICVGFLLSVFVMTFGSFLPEFLRPVLFVAVLLSGFSTAELAVCMGMFLSTVLCIVLGSSVQELALYSLFALTGGMLADAMDSTKKEQKRWHGVIVICLSSVLPALFCYWTYGQVDRMLFLYGAAEGIVVVLFLASFYHGLVLDCESEISDSIDDMLDPMNPLLQELANFSKAEYQHAKRVSELAKKCAAFVGADETLCAVAGLYYRIGILEKGTIAESGMRIAERECFPEEIARIIREYNGEKFLPTSAESAIVHMVDGLIKKMEVLDEQTFSNKWNQDMLIYQTLDDFSKKGIYDASGLSMNMFLKIRDYLIKEETLL
ncbi:MAG: hypothetical protein PUB98_08825 [Clostridiales bacterium]|nr:hypothetical protein [Clostridiales bacterium]